MIGGGVKPMMAILIGTLSWLPSGVNAANLRSMIVHGLKIGLPSRTLFTFASTNG